MRKQASESTSLPGYKTSILKEDMRFRRKGVFSSFWYCFFNYIYMHICIYMYICMYVCMYVCMYKDSLWKNKSDEMIIILRREENECLRVQSSTLISAHGNCSRRARYVGERQSQCMHA